MQKEFEPEATITQNNPKFTPRNQPEPIIPQRYSNLQKEFEQIVFDATLNETSYFENISNPEIIDPINIRLNSIEETLESMKYVFSSEIAGLRYDVSLLAEKIDRFIEGSLNKDSHISVLDKPFTQCKTFDELRELNEALKNDKDLFSNTVSKIIYVPIVKNNSKISILDQLSD